MTGRDPGSVLAGTFPLSARAPVREKRREGERETEREVGNSMFCDCNRSFCQDGRVRKADNRDEEEEEEGEGESKSTEGKRARARKKKNRRSVGKRNYRLMRRSFRHVGFERESAIGRCFFAKVIRVFARSISLSLSFSPFYYSLRLYILFRSRRRSRRASGRPHGPP